MSFQEKDLEEMIVDLIANKGYTHLLGEDIPNRQFEDVLIEDDLRTFLSKTYSQNNITTQEIDQIISHLKNVSSSVYMANKQVYREIVDGRTLKRINKTQKDFHFTLIDFDNVDNNIFKVCNQVVIKGKEKRIPDTIVYINGLPMIVWEYKSTTREDATIFNAFEQITIRYKRDIPELFKYNAFVVISDGINTKMGSLFADYEHFYAWRKVDENEEIKNVEGAETLYTMIDGLFDKERLLKVLKNFVYFPDDTIKDELKVVCSYPQYYAATKLYNNILTHMKPNGDGKGGTYFGTTGCGKSYCMLFLSRLLMRSKDLKSPTLLLITDRKDLDDQLSNVFVNSKEFLNEKEVVSFDSKATLGTTLKDKQSGGVYLTTVQKFTDDLSLLSDRANIICISDECHRTQNNLDEKTIIKNEQVFSSYGYAKYLHDTLPNATYVGYSGTPTDSSIQTFGNIVEEYTMKDSIRDGVTVKLVYDGRFVKATLDSEKLAEIEAYYQECLDNGANEHQVEESKKKSVNIETIIGNKEILSKVADNFIQHYENRVNEGATVAGKCMFVCSNRFIAYDFYKLIQEKRPKWFEIKRSSNEEELSEKELKELKPMPMIKMVMTRGKDDPKDLYDLLGDEESRKEDAKQFKKINSNFKIAIVVDMWLTGFDVPFLDTIYIDKLITQEHTIIQAISRVNRSYEGKESGLIVDFVGIKTGMNKALKKYAKFEEGNIEGIEKAIEIVKEKLIILDQMMYGFDNTKYFNGTSIEKFKCLNEATEYIFNNTKKDTPEHDLETRFMANVYRMNKAFGLCNGIKDFTQDELNKIHYYFAIRSIIFKLTKGKAPDISQMNKKVQEMVQGAIISENVEEIFTKEKDIDKSIDLFSEEYLKKINAIELPNTKVKILQQLLNQAIDEFKKVNKIKAINFSERMKLIVENYNLRATDEIIVNQTAEQIIELLKELKEEQASFENLGIDYEEKAFYDVLVECENKYNFTYPEDKNIELAKAIRQLVTNTTKYADWSNRNDIKAKLKVDIIRLLTKNGYPAIPKGTQPPEDYEKIYKDVIEQTENFKKYYNE